MGNPLWFFFDKSSCVALWQLIFNVFHLQCMRWVIYLSILDNFPSRYQQKNSVTRHENNWSLRGGYSLPFKHLLLITLSSNWLSRYLMVASVQWNEAPTNRGILILINIQISFEPGTMWLKCQQHNNKVMMSVNPRMPVDHPAEKVASIQYSQLGQGMKLEQLVIFMEEHSIFMAIASKNIRQ